MHMHERLFHYVKIKVAPIVITLQYLEKEAVIHNCSNLVDKITVTYQVLYKMCCEEKRIPSVL